MKKLTQVSGLFLATLIVAGCDVPKQVEHTATGILNKITLPYNLLYVDVEQKQDTSMTRTLDTLSLEKDTTFEKITDYEQLITHTLTHISSLKEDLIHKSAIEHVLPPLDNNLKINKDNVAGISSLLKTFQELSHDDYRYIHNIVLVGIGEHLNFSYAEIEIQGLERSVDFMTVRYSLYFKENELTEVKMVNQPLSKPYTSKAFDKASGANPNIHEQALENFKVLLTKNYRQKNISQNEGRSILLGLGLTNTKDGLPALMELYRATNGDFTRAKITGFIHYDDNATGLTRYQVSVPTPDSHFTEYFTFVVERETGKWLDITTDDVFNGGIN